jgi:NTE family protein
LQWVVDSQPRVDIGVSGRSLERARRATARSRCRHASRNQYSSRTRAGTDNFKDIQRLRRAMADLFEKLPEL